MDKTREEFVHFIRQAVEDRGSPAYMELYSFLLGCFTRADKNLDGTVEVSEFDTMIEEAAVLPRKYGFAPKTEDLFPSVDARKTARAKMFCEIDSNSDSCITFEEWLTFSMNHIMEKVVTLSKNIFTDTEQVTKEEFLAFINKAVNKATPEYRELYFFLLKCFTDADSDHNGAVDPHEFDKMIEVAAAAPRRFGLAPETKQMFRNDAERLMNRTKAFMEMDTREEGRISFDQWLQFSITHIIQKVADIE